jgi:hypothetical protein
MRPFRFAGWREPTFEKIQVWRGNDDVCVELVVTKSQCFGLGNGDTDLFRGRVQIFRAICCDAVSLNAANATPNG